ncbi:uncharacterized protein LOC108622733 [Ceratina calcarata]|uniref:Uncharacterized protein LOC108622733 n=1 Tax=Ceratina calcarata TaxID=156304 RepID=A0AAJ7W929_9HYME|nr:uncharacterized protein LOC108622733 [Ceratina calcarata]
MPLHRYTHAVLCRIPLSLRTRGEVTLNEARTQHLALAQLLRELDIDVVELPLDENSPLCAFVEDIAVVCNGIALIARPSEPSRLKERNIKLFGGERYSIWKLRVCAIMSEHDVIEVIYEDAPDMLTAEWIKAERIAKNVIVEYLSDSFLGFAKPGSTAKNILKSLDKNEQKNLLAAGAKLEETDKVSHLVLTLPTMRGSCLTCLLYLISLPLLFYEGREFFVGLSHYTNEAGAKAVAAAFPEYPCAPIKVGDGGEEVIVESLTSAPIQVWVS